MSLIILINQINKSGLGLLLKCYKDRWKTILTSVEFSTLVRIEKVSCYIYNLSSILADKTANINYIEL